MTSSFWLALLEECVLFTQRLIQTPSMPTEEENIAHLLSEEMSRIGYDEVWIDEIGNVNGRVWGQDRSLGALVFNSHLDHVDPGELDLWSFPPYSGTVHQGRIIGRGACDIKGPLAVQVYSLASLVRQGIRPKRDVVVSAVVQEETGGAGAIYWIENLDYSVELMVLGEPSSNHISLGHRGIWQSWVQFNGRSVHASVPNMGINPNYSLAEFINRLGSGMDLLSEHPVLGRTSVAPTIVEVDTRSSNVTPAWSRVMLDFRSASESVRSLRAFIHQMGHGLDPQLISPGPEWMEVDEDRPLAGFYTEPDSATVTRVQELVARGMGWKPELGSYQFATDGRHIAARNNSITILGYSPAEESMAHTADESISLDKMLDGLKGHVELMQHY